MPDLSTSLLSFLRRAGRYAVRRLEQRGPIRHDVEIVASPRRDAFVAALLARCTSEGVLHMTGAGADERRPRLHFREVDGARVCAAIVAAATTAGVAVQLRPAGAPGIGVDRLVEQWRRHRWVKFDLHVLEHAMATPDDVYRCTSVVEVDLWHVDERSFRGARYATAPRYNTVATSLRRETLDALMGADGHAPVGDLGAWDRVPDLYARDFPIDVVYTWVDDKDPRWLAVKSEYRPTAAASAAARGESRNDLKERFNNRDELRYSLRSLEMFAPFVRNIYLVTMDQVPAWLDTSHPQVTVVDHRDIYADPAALPTFNSSSIETQLHHIDGLAEHFIYFNDDVFLGSPCTWSDFFDATGRARFFTADHTIAAADVADDGEEYLIADRNAIRLFEAEFGFTVHRPMAHVPHTARRSVLCELEERFQAEFDACQRERFRSRHDLRPIAFMGHHYGFATGRAAPGTIRHRYLALWKPMIAAQLDGVLRDRRYRTFCVNDVGVAPEREHEIDRLVGRFLDRYFPFRSRFELPPR